MTKTKVPRHEAEQFELAKTLGLTITLKDSYARLWAELVGYYAKKGIELSAGQVAKSMIQRGLDEWDKERQKGLLP